MFVIAPHRIVKIIIVRDQPQSFVSVVQLQPLRCAELAVTRTDTVSQTALTSRIAFPKPIFALRQGKSPVLQSNMFLPRALQLLQSVFIEPNCRTVEVVSQLQPDKIKDGRNQISVRSDLLSC